MGIGDRLGILRITAGRNRVKVAFVIFGDLDQRSGGYLYDRQVVRSLERSGHTIRVVGLKAKPALGAIAGLRRAGAGEALGDLSDFDWVVIDELVHPALFAVRSLLARLPARKALLVHHLAISEALHPLSRVLHLLAERALLRHVDLVITTSESTAAVVGGLAGGIETVVCRPGIERPPKSKRTGPGRTIRLLTTGNIIPRKGHLLLLEAIARLDPAADVHLAIAGNAATDRRHADRVARTITRLRLGNRVTMSGYLSDEKLIETYRSSDLFLSASQHEGYGISLAESLSHGLAFVAFDTPAFREVAPSAVPVADAAELDAACSASAAGHGLAERTFSGVLVRYPNVALFANAVSRIAADRELRRRMSEQARADVKHLGSWADTGACFESALRQAREQPRGG